MLQDDVTLCAHFNEILHSAVRSRPDRVLMFFVQGRPPIYAQAFYTAAAKGLSWTTMPRLLWLPTVATCWPASLIKPVLEHIASKNWPDRFRADDEITGRAVKALGIVPLASVPSLVQHEDVHASVIGLKARGGRDKGRCAACWIGDCDGRTIDWSLGPI